MLAGPPRLVSLLSILVLLGLGWWYIRLIQFPTSTSSSSSLTNPLKTDTRPEPGGGGFKSDALDFSYPPRFTEGKAKEPGSNYTYALVIPKTMKEDIGWMYKDMPEVPLVVYEVDNPNAENRIPSNKGREAMVYLSYIIDNWDKLPDTVLFMHAHRHAWHNNVLQGLDAAQIVKSLNHDRVARHGYMNLRCHHKPGCPDWIHMDRPGGDFDFFNKPEEIYWRKNIWEEIHPGAPIPPTLSGVCCAQFAVSSDRIRQVPKERFVHYRRWLLETPMDDQFSGRIFEYIWHYIFTGHEVYCPAMNTCYCDGYGFCFGGRRKFEEYFEKLDKRNQLNEELDVFKKKEDEAKEKGTTVTWTEMERKKIDELGTKIGGMDKEMEVTRNEALERGRDPKARMEEMETYDSSHIWDYAPKYD